MKRKLLLRTNLGVLRQLKGLNYLNEKGLKFLEDMEEDLDEDVSK